ncbi:MAG TPA: bifunctional nuclease family protein, partial [Myxococcaceae bacterium]|nr:bifunctional nuclease family protein [Myxococcaceae bacterium]
MERSARISLLLTPLAAVALAVGIFLSIPGGRGGIPRLSGLYWPPSTAVAGPSNQPRPAEGLVELTVRDVVPIAEANTHAVVLVSRDEQMVLPLFVTEEAAVSIAFRLAHQDSPHPLAADLLDDVVESMGGTVTEVQIDDVRDDIYTGHVVIKQGQRNHKLNARPSDAIAMALSGKAKIFCTQKVLAQAGISREEIEALQNQMGVGGGPPRPGAPMTP